MEARTLRTLHPTLVREDLISPEQQLRWITRQLRELREANAALTARVQQLEEAFAGHIPPPAAPQLQPAPTVPSNAPAPRPSDSAPVPAHQPDSRPRPVLARFDERCGVFGNHRLRREQVTAIVFLGTCSGAPAEAWDVSLWSDGSAWAWAEETDEGLTLCIAGEGGVSANPDAAGLFSNYSSLTRIDFGGHFSTGQVCSMNSLFRLCLSLEDIDLSGFNTANVADMSDMFSSCVSLTALDLSGFQTGRVTNFSRMFSRCRSLKSLNLSAFDTAKATDMSWMFSDCGSLSTLDLSGFDTARVTDMSGMFSGCSSLASLDLSHFNTSYVTDMRWMFADCGSLTALDLSSFRTFRVTNMSKMFAQCHQLTSIILSDFSGINAKDKSGMFANCHSLTANTRSCLRSKNLPV